MTVPAVVLLLWTLSTEKQVHYTPEYEKTDLGSILEKQELTGEEYDLFLAQTGLGKTGVDELYRQGLQEKLLYLQQRFFAPVEYECRRSWIFYHFERLVQGDGESEAPSDFLPAVQTGDVLISFNGHFFGWRSGHAAIVTDAGRGETLEAVCLGTDSRICPLEQWRTYPSFILLRLKGASRKEREELGSYAAEELVGIPYQLFSLCGVEGRGTQCAHLVWMAFSHFGYDLDSDGGIIVTPYDIYKSDLLEVIQVYGILPNI